MAAQAALLANQLTATGEVIGNALSLPRDVWGEWDSESVTIQRAEMVIFNDLAATLSRPMPIGKLIHYFRTVSDSGSVNVSLDGRSKANLDKPVFDYQGTPVPIIDSTFGFGWREMAAAQSEGFALDDAGRVNAVDKVTKKLESLALDGDANIVVGGAPLYGLRNHPNRKTRTTGQALNGATGAQWLSEVTATVKLLRDADIWAPVTIYVNAGDWFFAGNRDYAANYAGTIAKRIREIDGIANIVPSPTVAAGQIIAVVKDRRVLSVLNAMPVTTRAMFRANPEDDYNFVTLAAAAVEMKPDAAGNLAVAVSSL
nr:major capsid protein [Paracoccus fontiphilus]